MKNEPKRKALMRWGLISLVLTVATATPILLFSGCGENPLSPIESVQGTDAGGFFDQEYDGAFFEGGGPSFTVGIDEDIQDDGRNSFGQSEIDHEDGGKVSLSGGSHSFVVEPNSIEYDTEISVSLFLFQSKKFDVGLFNFTPDGLQFDPAATLKLDVKKLAKPDKQVDLYRYNPATSRWEYQTSVTAGKDGFVSLPIEHFSGYGVSNMRAYR